MSWDHNPHKPGTKEYEADNIAFAVTVVVLIVIGFVCAVLWG